MKGALDLNHFDLSDSVMESILDNHSTGRFVLDDSTVHRFHQMFWTKAAAAYHSLSTKTALKLYMYSLSFPTDTLPTSDLSNLQANIAWCHLKENHPAEAQVYASMSTENLRSLYVQFKVALAAGDTHKAEAMLRSLRSQQQVDEDSELREGLLSLAVTDAFHAESRCIAIVALESLCSDDADVNDTHLLRCLVRLKYTQFEEQDFRTKWNDLLHLVQLAGSKIKQHTSTAAAANDGGVHAELEWWARITWQFGLESCEY